MQNHTVYKNQKDILTVAQWADRAVSVVKLIDNATNPNLSQGEKVQNFLADLCFTTIKEGLSYLAHREIESQIASLIFNGERTFGDAVENSEIDNIGLLLADSFILQINAKSISKSEIGDYLNIIEQIKEIHVRNFRMQLISTSEILVNAEVSLNENLLGAIAGKYNYRSKWMLINNCYKLVRIECSDIC